MGRSLWAGSLRCVGLLCGTLFVWAAMAAAAVGVPPTIETAAPNVGTRGEPFRVALTGSGFGENTGVLFYSPLIRCVAFEASSEFEAEATIVADPACPLGTHAFRVTDRDGISSARILRLTPLPVIDEPARPAADGTNRPAAGEAVVIERANVTIRGTLLPQDRDRYVLRRKKGERISAQVEAIRLGASLLDTVLSIRGPDGKILASVDDTAMFQQDPAASVIADQDGDYTVEIHETNYDGSPDSHYALHLGDFPPVTVAYPAGGPAGETVTVTFPAAGGSPTQTVRVPPLGRDFALFRESGDGRVSVAEIPFRRSPFGNVLEAEPNDENAGRGPAGSVPLAFNGILSRPGDVDCFAFQAEAGQPLRIEVFATRIGSPADTRIEIREPSGVMLAQNDDWDSHDSRIDWTPPRSGRFELAITDKLDFGGPDAVYRVEMTYLQPSVTAFLPRPERKSQKGQTIAVPLGNRTLVQIGVRRQYVDGPVGVDWADLPGGVRASGGSVSPDQFWTPVVLEAAPDAETGAGLCRLDVTCSDDAGSVIGGFRQGIDLVAASADRLFQSVQLDRIPLAVADPVPFHVDLQTPATFLPAGGTLELQIGVRRDPGFDAPVEVRLPFVPPWVVCAESIVIPGDQDRGVYRLEARPQVGRRAWPIAVTATIDAGAAGGESQKWIGRQVSSELIELSISDPPVVGRLAPLAAEQGVTFTADCEIETDGVVPAELDVTLEGLPNRITAPSVRWRPGQGSVRFEVRVAPDAPVGVFGDLAVRMSGELDGVGVSYVVAAGTELLIAPPGKLIRGSGGEVLSPLEVLRRSQSR